jgi:hypothetical protein
MTVNRKLQTTAVAGLLACVTVLGALPAMAEHPAVPTCMDIHWNAELLKAFPRAPVVCQSIAVRHGKNYARFTAKVTAVGADAVKVRFLNAAGDPEREVSLKPGADARVMIAGQKVEYSKLQKDDVLTFWVPEQQLGVISDPDATAASTIVLN